MRIKIKQLLKTKLGFISVAFVVSAFTILDYLFKWGAGVKFLQVAAAVISAVRSYPQRTFDAAFFVWLLTLTIMVLVLKRRVSLVQGDFVDDFKFGLRGWDTDRGEWEIENNELSVKNSGLGGLTKRGVNWTDYVFEFAGKIINKNISPLVRAEDLNNYVMFQIQEDKVVPHLRCRGIWFVDDARTVPLDKSLKKLQPYRFKLTVQDTKVYLAINDEEVLHYEIPEGMVVYLGSSPRGLYHISELGKIEKVNPLVLSFRSGRIGFREFGDEHAHVSRVRVRTLL